MNPEKIKKDARRKKAVYGWTSLILTVVIVALVILGNAVLYKINWRIDLTAEKIYTVSDEADKIFSALGNRDIEIIFFTPFDELGNNMSQNMLYQYCLSLEQRYDYISLRYIDLLNHPEAAKPYQSTNVPDIDLDDVIISNGEGGFKKCKIEWFFNFDRDSNSLVGFYAEYRIASTIMQLSYDERLALFTTGHGEEIEGTMVCTLLQDAGFTVRSIDLSKEDIPDGTRLLIINDPMYDFKGVENTVNELSKVDRYLDGYGNLIVFESPEKSSGLRNLSELLSEWGIEFVSNARVHDDHNAISADGASVLAKYDTDTSQPGGAFCKNICSKGNPPNTVMSDCMPIKLLFDTKNSITTGTVLTSNATAVANSTSDGSEVMSGEMPLMTVSVKAVIGENNETYYSYVVAVGTSDFVDDEFIGGNIYGNRDIFYEVVRQFGNEIVPVDLNLRWLDENKLDITIGEARTWTLVLIGFMPIAATVVCVAVYRRRKHR